VEFKQHALVYVVVIGFLGLVNFLTSRSFPWFLFPAGGWGVGLAAHYLFAYGSSRGPFSVDREYQRLKRKQDQGK
jgi:hypothetical protein